MRAWIRRSFRNRIFVTILLITLLPLLLCTVVMMQVQMQRSETGMAEQAGQELLRAEAKFEGLMTSFGDIADGLCSNTMMHSALRRENKSSHVAYQLMFRMTDDMREFAKFEIFDRNGSCQYSTDNSIPPAELEPGWGILYAAGNSQELVYRSGTGGGLVAARAIREYSGDILGYVVISMNRENFDLLLSDIYSPANSIMVLDKYWYPVYLAQPVLADTTVSVLRSQLLANEQLTDVTGECNYITEYQEKTGFTFILKQPKVFTDTVRDTIFFVSTFMGVICLALCMWASWRLSRHLASPVHRLDAAMGEVQKGNFDVYVKSSREDELGHLADSFNLMAEEYRKNLKRTVEHQKEINATQLRMLQAQLNPHFLYNTLDSIKWMGVSNDASRVADMATSLAVLLRAGISGSEFITLSEELELIEKYIAIQAIRFEDRFTYETDVAEKYQSCLVPKLVLQPLVENSIIHGISESEFGYIKLSAVENDGDLVISVSDNGCGIPEEILSQLNDQGKRIPGQHLGLFNVSSIIRLYFGDKYGITAESEPGNGSCIRVRLPIQREEKHA